MWAKKPAALSKGTKEHFDFKASHSSGLEKNCNAKLVRYVLHLKNIKFCGIISSRDTGIVTQFKTKHCLLNINYEKKIQHKIEI